MIPRDPLEPVPERMEAIAAAVPGWTPIDQLCALHNLVLATSDLPGDVVEIGSWCGRSTIALALAVRATGHGRVHAIDPFPARDDWHANADGSHSFRVRMEDGSEYTAYTEQTVWDEPFQRDIRPLYDEHPSLLEYFNANLDMFGVRDLVDTHRGDAARFDVRVPPDAPCRLAFLDGDHGYAAVMRDIDIVERRLVPGGWIGFDDAFTGYEGVDQAIRERIIDGGGYELGHRATRKLFVARRISACRA